ncbi:MAG: hypothetical protein ACK4IS_07895 [Erythrobacter sp.]
MAEFDVEQRNGERQPPALSLYTASVAFDDLQSDAEELAALAWLVSGNKDFLDEPAAKALRAICTLAEGLARRAGELGEEYMAASRADRGANVADFPAR